MDTKINVNQLQSELEQFTSSEEFYKHGKMIISEGVKHLFDTVGAYWFGDILNSYLGDKRIKDEEFLTLNLKLHPDDSCTVFIDDGNNNKLISQEVEFTDFPMDIKLFFANDTLYLPSEH